MPPIYHQYITNISPIYHQYTDDWAWCMSLRLLSLILTLIECGPYAYWPRGIWVISHHWFLLYFTDLEWLTRLFWSLRLSSWSLRVLSCSLRLLSTVLTVIEFAAHGWFGSGWSFFAKHRFCLVFFRQSRSLRFFLSPCRSLRLLGSLRLLNPTE